MVIWLLFRVRVRPHKPVRTKYMNVNVHFLKEIFNIFRSKNLLGHHLNRQKRLGEKCESAYRAYSLTPSILFLLLTNKETYVKSKTNIWYCSKLACPWRRWLHGHFSEWSLTTLTPGIILLLKKFIQKKILQYCVLFENCVSALSLTLRTSIDIVVDYGDTMSA